MTDLDDKSPEDLQALLAAAQAQLEARIQGKRKEVVAQIKELASSIGATVDIQFTKATHVSSVIAKYRDPTTGKTWSGRGLMPKWLQAHVNAGRSKEQYLIQN